MARYPETKTGVVVTRPKTLVRLGAILENNKIAGAALGNIMPTIIIDHIRNVIANLSADHTTLVLTISEGIMPAMSFIFAESASRYAHATMVNPARLANMTSRLYSRI